jgi:hypothetical protein
MKCLNCFGAVGKEDEQYEEGEQEGTRRPDFQKSVKPRWMNGIDNTATKNECPADAP